MDITALLEQIAAQRDITGVRAVALHRLVCLGLLWNLTERSLKEAYDSLIDIYTLQKDRARAVDNVHPEPHWVPVFVVDPVERIPFQFHDE